MSIFEFTWPHPAGEVLVAGTFNEWKGSKLCKNESGLFTALVDLGEAEKVCYKYIVDGHWTVNYDGKREYDNSGNENNVLYPEDWRKAPTPSIQETPVQEDPEVLAVSPLPASTTASNPITLQPGEPVPSVVPQSVEDTVHMDKESYEEADASNFSVSPEITSTETIEVPVFVEETQEEEEEEAQVTPQASAVPEAVEANKEVEEELEAIVPVAPAEPEPQQKNEEIPAPVERTVELENQPPATNSTRCVSPTMSPLTTPAAPTTHVYTVGVPGATFNSVPKVESAPSTRSSSASSHESHNEKRELFREKTSEKKKEKRRSVILGRILNLFK
ncbi:hypothetical protein EV426DRAFT_570673 [Tirmania nivea]|nr:hypothetical protein EV426DRAFT_570673 [Tirmania nivea]